MPHRIRNSGVPQHMDDPIIICVTYNGECKLIAVDKSTSYADFESQVIGKWGDLLSKKILCICSVGSFSNVCLEGDDDLRNLFTLCSHASLKIVTAEVRTKITPHGKSLVSSSENGLCSSSDNDLGGDCSVARISLGPNHSSDANNSSRKSKKRTHLGNTVAQQAEIIEQDDITAYDVSPNVEKNYISAYDVSPSVEKNGISAYDVSPNVSETPLLSDDWVNLMTGGVGSEFEGGVVQFRADLIKYTAKIGYGFKFVRNEKRYVHAKCTETGCDWFIQGKRLKNSTSFVIANANLVHKCNGKLPASNSKRLGPRIMGGFVLPDVKNDPNITGKNVKHVMKESYGIDIPYWTAHRLADAAKSEIIESFDKSYNELRWYFNAVERTNPGSIVDLQTNNETHRFERLFIAFKACIDGFKSCRPMLFLDGTFMKGRAKGTLLSATAKDGNNGLFPVAFAHVSVESTENWTWFLEKLRDFVTHDKQIFYISDKNREILNAFPNVFDQPFHFYCLHHLLTNLKGRFSTGWTNLNREKLVQRFKDCAYAPNEIIFEKKIAIFKEMGGKMAEEWLEQLPYEKWAIAHSPHITRYGEMTSNDTESFTAWIEDFRSLPVTKMIDSIRSGISRWFVERRHECHTWSGDLVASKEQMWNQLLNASLKMSVFVCPSGVFEVDSTPSVVVNLDKRTCSCYQWQIRGFPCVHAAAVIRIHGQSISSYIEDYFFTFKYRECYSVDIHPIPETEEFEFKPDVDQHEILPLDQHEILPPLLKNRAGRPKKSRTESAGECPKKKKNCVNAVTRWVDTSSSHVE